MEKIKLVIASAIALSLIPSPVFSWEVWSYSLSPVQARFYLLILGIIASSIIMVASAYLLFWLLDLQKKAKENSINKPLNSDVGHLRNKYVPAK